MIDDHDWFFRVTTIVTQWPYNPVCMFSYCFITILCHCCINMCENKMMTMMMMMMTDVQFHHQHSQTHQSNCFVAGSCSQYSSNNDILSSSTRWDITKILTKVTDFYWAYGDNVACIRVMLLTAISQSSFIWYDCHIAPRLTVLSGSAVCVTNFSKSTLSFFIYGPSHHIRHYTSHLQFFTNDTEQQAPACHFIKHNYLKQFM